MRASPARTVGPSGCSRNSNPVTMPKSPPPPRRPQNRSACSCRPARTTRPSASTTSAEKEVVAGQSVLAGRPSAAAAGGEPADAGGGDPPAGGAESVRLRGRVELSPPHAPAGPRRPGTRVDGEGRQAAEVDQHPVVARTRPGDAVAAAAHRHDEPVGAGGVDGRRDVRGVRRAGDERRAAADHGVEHLAALVIARLPGPQHLAGESLAQHSGRIGDGHGSSLVRPYRLCFTGSGPVRAGVPRAFSPIRCAKACACRCRATARACSSSAVISPGRAPGAARNTARRRRIPASHSCAPRPMPNASPASARNKRQVLHQAPVR